MFQPTVRASRGPRLNTALGLTEMTVRQFQLLVLATTAGYGAYLALPFLGWPPVDAETANFLSWSFYGAPAFAYHPFAFVALFASRLAIAYGLIAFFTWSRLAYLVWLLITVMHSALSGLLVLEPVTATLGYLLTLADGAILGIAYSKHFEGLWRADGEAQQRVPADGPASRARG